MIRRNREIAAAQSENFRNAKKELKKAIYGSDVMHKLRKQSGGSALESDQLEDIVLIFFPTHSERAGETGTAIFDNVSLFSKVELSRTPDVLKAVANACPQILLSMYKYCLSEGVFHACLSNRQYGFKRCHCIISAVNEVVETIQRAQRVKDYLTSLVLPVTLYVPGMPLTRRDVTPSLLR